MNQDDKKCVMDYETLSQSQRSKKQNLILGIIARLQLSTPATSYLRNTILKVAQTDTPDTVNKGTTP